MKTIKFYEIPELIKCLEFDGDKTDLILHHDVLFTFSAETEEEYNQIENLLDSFEILGNGFEIYFNYDVSGYNYWVKQQQERTTLTISVRFENEDVVSGLNLLFLELSLEHMIETAKEINRIHNYEPNN